MSLIDFRLEDGTLLGPEGLDLGALQAGTESAPLILDLCYRWGEPPDGDRLEDLVFRVATEDPSRGGVGVLQGVPPQDQLWARGRFVGQAGDPAQPGFRTDWQPLGAFAGIPFPSLYAGSRRRLELVWQLPASASGSWTFLPTVYAEVHSLAIAASVETGILHGVGDRGRSGLVRGGALSASSPADDQVHVAPRQLLAAGELLGQEAVSVPFDLLDGAGVELADTEHYRARLVATGDGVEVRKGEQALESLAPPLEPGDLASLGVVRVEAPPGGGPPIVGPEDVEEGPRFDRHRVEAVPGRLELVVHAGDAVGGGTWRFWHQPSPAVPLAASSVQWLWQLADGRYEVKASPEPPASTALGPWAEIETDSVEVIRLEDRRTYAGVPLILSSTGSVPSSPGLVARLVVPVEVQVEEILISVDSEPGGALTFDLVEEGITRLVAGTEPTFDVGAPLTHREALFASGRCHAGTVLELHAVTVPASPPATVQVHLIARP